MSGTLLSVCMPNYNHGRYLKGAVDALLSQSVQPDEIIIVDDASTDESVSVIEELGRKEPRIKLLKNEINQGCCLSANRAMAAASGDFIFNTAADDLVLPGYFEKTVSSLEKHPQAGVAITQIKYIDPEGNDIPGEKLLHNFRPREHVKITTATYLSPAAVLARLQRQPWFINGGPSPLYRREVLLEAGGWHDKLGPYTDWFGAHFAALKHGMVYIPETLVAFRVVPGSFGESAWRSPLAALEKLRCVLELMRQEKYRDVFPGAFVRKKEKMFPYVAFSSSFTGAHRDFRWALEKAMPATSVLDRLLLHLFNLLLNAEKLALRAYCANKHQAIYQADDKKRPRRVEKAR